MAKNWKHTKKLLEGLLCDKLKDRITYQLHCYRPDDDWTGHLEILLDKKPIFRAGSCLAKNPNYCVHMSEAEIRRIMMKYLKADSVNGSAGVNSTNIRTATGFICSYIRNCQRQEQGRIFLEDVMVMLGEYLSSDIETNLKSGSPFINALSVLDRRVGKRRLQKIADRGSSVAPMWAWPFYEARFEAEGIKCAWNFSL